MRSTRTATRQRGRIGKPRRSPATDRRGRRALEGSSGRIVCRIHGVVRNIEVCIKTHTTIVIAILGILAFIVFVLVVVVLVIVILVVVVARLPLVLAKLGMVLFRDMAIV